MSLSAICKELRGPWYPEVVRGVLLFESPPASGPDKYFYNAKVEGGTLYSAVMDALYGEVPPKAEGLARMKTDGWLLEDATYTPVNTMTRAGRVSIMQRDFNDLVERLPVNVPIVICMCTVLDAVGFPLSRKRWVLNEGRRVPFPSHNMRARFKETLREILNDRRPM